MATVLSFPVRAQVQDCSHGKSLQPVLLLESELRRVGYDILTKFLTLTYSYKELLFPQLMHLQHKPRQFRVATD